MKKIVLGTAQFGMDYGINNKRGKIPQSEVFEILNKAIKFGINIVDTSYDYGESEKVLGNFMKSYGKKLKIISKLPERKCNEVEKTLIFSLNKLGISSFYGYLVHNFGTYKKDQRIWDKLEKLKNGGKVEKTGFSIYLTSELEFLLENNVKADIIQIPYNIFDQRFKEYFPEIKRRGIEIYIRSIFLQGLIFKKPDELNGYFEGIKDKIEYLNLLSQQTKIPIFALCLGFVYRSEFIDKIVVGVDNMQNLEEIIQVSTLLPKLDNIISKLSNLRVDDKKIILPFNWKFIKAKVSGVSPKFSRPHKTK